MIRYATSRPPHYHNGFRGYLYNRKAFLDIKCQDILSFYALYDERQCIVAQVHFVLQELTDTAGRQAVSLPESPFGSLEYDRAYEYLLEDFLRFAIQDLQQKGISSVEIRHFAAAYDQLHTAALSVVFGRLNFKAAEVTDSHLIQIDQLPLQSKMHPWEVRKLKKCRKAAFMFRKESVEKLEQVYDFIRGCRLARQHRLSLSFDQLSRQVGALPDCYHLFALYDQQQMIAAAITVKAGWQVLYTFYYAGLAAYNAFSPTVMLLEGIYSYCQENGICLIDLGTSPSPSVAQFKAHMGGIPSPKTNFRLTL